MKKNDFTTQLVSLFFVILVEIACFYLINLIVALLSNVLLALIACNILIFTICISIIKIQKMKLYIIGLFQYALMNQLILGIMSYADFNFGIRLRYELSILIILSIFVYFFSKYFLLTNENNSSEKLKDGLFNINSWYVSIVNAILLFMFVLLLNKYGDISSLKYRSIMLLFSILGVLLLIYSGVIVIKNKKMLTKNMSGQMSIVLGILALFWNIAALSPYTLKTGFYSSICMISTLLIYNFYFVLFLYIYIRRKNSKRTFTKNSILLFIKENPFVYVVVLFGGLFLIDIKVNPIFDSALYFKYISQIPAKFNFTPIASFRALQVVNHSSGALSGYYLLGQFFSPYNQIVANIQSLIIMVIAIAGFEKILKYFYCESKYKWQRAAGAAIFAFSPTIYGASLQITSDLMIGIFLVLMISNALYGNKILTVFFAICMIFCKTPAIVIYFSFCVGMLLFTFTHDMIEEKKTIKGIIVDYWHYLIPFFSFGVWWLIMKDSIWAFENSGKVGSSIGISFDVILENILHVFAVNFYSIFYIIIVFAIILFFIKNKKLGLIIKNKKTVWIFVFITIFAGYFTFNCLFLTEFRHARYIIPLFVLNAIFVFLAVEYLFKNMTHKTVTLIIIWLLMITSTFRTYDPVLLKYFPYLKSDNQIYSMYDRTSAFSQVGTMTDIAIYNREYVYIDKLYVDFLNKVNYTDNDVTIFLDYDLWNAQLSGNPGHVSYLRTENGRKLNEFDPDHEIQAVSIKSDTIMTAADLPKNPYFIRLWHQDEELLDVIKQRYDVIEYIPINRFDYFLYAYKLKLKD
ncbi:MAG: hypothetical protein KAQ68_01555 [Clostridiales bacterium]|nr:hypothetical protein [Clostridiales bacterium]